MPNSVLKVLFTSFSNQDSVDSVTSRLWISFFLCDRWPPANKGRWSRSRKQVSDACGNNGKNLWKSASVRQFTEALSPICMGSDQRRREDEWTRKGMHLIYSCRPDGGQRNTNETAPFKYQNTWKKRGLFAESYSLFRELFVQGHPLNKVKHPGLETLSKLGQERVLLQRVFSLHQAQRAIQTWWTASLNARHSNTEDWALITSINNLLYSP